MSEEACPLDLSKWAPDAIIRRWIAAFEWSNGKEPPVGMLFKRGWFLLYPTFPQIRYRRKQVEAMIWRLENQARAGAEYSPASPPLIPWRTEAVWRGRVR